MNTHTDEVQVDLLELVKYLYKRAVIIIAATVAAAILGFLVTKLFITPTYTASTRIYLLNQRTDQLAASDFQISTYMLQDCKELIKGKNVTSEVISQLGLKLTDSALANKISISSPDNTRILQISVSDTKPEQAALIANTVREVSMNQLRVIFSTDSIQTVYEADVPKSAAGPNAMRNAVLAGLVACVFVAVIFTVMFILDDGIRNEDDVERYLGLSTLGVIPTCDELAAAPVKPAASKPQRPKTAADTGKK